jgi:hypothetical protein
MGLSQLQQKNVAAASAYTEYSFAVPPGIMQLTLILRPGGSTGSAAPTNLFWYMVTTNGSTPGSSSNLPQSPNTYNTIPLQNDRTINGKLGGQTIYFQMDQASQLPEVDYFSDV